LARELFGIAQRFNLKFFLYLWRLGDESSPLDASGETLAVSALVLRTSRLNLSLLLLTLLGIYKITIKSNLYKNQ
jgi:hypothetical protein